MKLPKTLILVMISTLWFLGSGAASAQDVAKAEALFTWGVEAMEAGRYDVGCPALAESYRLDPQPGALLTLGDCNERWGKIATAVAMYADYLRSVGQMKPQEKVRHDARAAWAAKQRKALLPDVPLLTLTLPASPPPNIQIKLDSTELTAASLGVPLPLDPGRHMLTTQVGKGPVVEQRVVLARRDRQTLEIEFKLPVPPPPPKKPDTPEDPANPERVVSNSRAKEAAPPRRAGAIPPAPAPAREPGISGRRIGALFAGGVGVAGLALGTATGVMVLDKKSVVDAHCSGSYCDAEGIAAEQSASVPMTLSTVGFCVGGAGIVTGLMLWLTDTPQPEAGRTERSVQPTMSAAPADIVVGLKGVW